jgi:hypothetical protein
MVHSTQLLKAQHYRLKRGDGKFNWYKLSVPNMALCLSNPLTEVNPGINPGLKKWLLRSIILKSESLKFMDNSGPSHACNRIAVHLCVCL